jgi:DNA-binding beta-propeller fold protein YncE
MRPDLRHGVVAAGTAALCALLVVAAVSAMAAEPVGAPANRVVIGGPGGWDYLAMDPARHHLFIARGDRVQVFDAETMAVTAEIAGTDGVHGVALARERNIGLTSNGASNSVSMFDLVSLKKIGQIVGIGDGPDAIVYDRRSSRAFAFNGRSHDATVIDVDTARVIGTIALPGKPEFAAADEQGSIFVNIEDRDSIARLDIATLKVTAVWPLFGCVGPTGLAIDIERRRLFVSCSNRTLAVVNAISGSVVDRLPIGAGSDAVAFDAQRSLVLSSNRDGTLSVIRQDDADHYSSRPAITTRSGARTVALDPSTHRAYLVTSDFEPFSTPASGIARQRRPTPIPDTFSVLWVDLPESTDPASKK